MVTITKKRPQTLEQRITCHYSEWVLDYVWAKPQILKLLQCVVLWGSLPFLFSSTKVSHSITHQLKVYGWQPEALNSFILAYWRMPTPQFHFSDPKETTHGHIFQIKGKPMRSHVNERELKASYETDLLCHSSPLWTRNKTKESRPASSLAVCRRATGKGCLIWH